MCIVTGKGQEAWQPMPRHGHGTAVPARAHTHDTAPCAHDTTGPSHDTAWPRPPTLRDTVDHYGHDTAMRAPGSACAHLGVLARPAGCALGAPSLFLTQFFLLSTVSESLFGPGL